MKGKNKRNVVLIADDDLFVRKIISTAIGDLADIVEVVDGAGVEQAYKTCNPDIVFMDVHLPNISGIELTRKIKKNDVGAYVVMISADSNKDNVLLSHRIGARGFLVKPFEKSSISHLFNKCPTISFMDC